MIGHSNFVRVFCGFVFFVALFAGHGLAVEWTGGTGDWNDASNWDGGVLPNVSDWASANIGSGDNPQITADLTINPRFILMDGGTIDHSGGLVQFSNGGPEMGYGSSDPSVYNLSGGEMNMPAAPYSDINIGLTDGSGLSSFNISGTGFLNQTGVSNAGRGIQVGRISDGELVLSGSAKLFTAGTLRNGGDTASGEGTIRITGGDVSINATDSYTQDETATLDLFFSNTNAISAINTQADAQLAGTLNLTFGATPSAGDQFTIITAAQGVSGEFAAVNVRGAPGWSREVNVTTDGGAVVVSVIPEPSVLVLGTLAGLLVLPFMRRR